MISIPIKNHLDLMKSNKELFGHLKPNPKTNQFEPYDVSEEKDACVNIETTINAIQHESDIKKGVHIIFHTHPKTETPCPSLEDYILSMTLIQYKHIDASVVVSEYGYAMITNSKVFLAIDFTKNVLNLINDLDKFDGWWTLQEHSKLLKKYGLIVKYHFLDIDYSKYKYKYDKKYKTELLNGLRDIYEYNMFKIY